MLALFSVLSIVMILFRPDYRRLPKRVALVFLYPLFVSVFIPFANEGQAPGQHGLKAFYSYCDR